MTITACSISLAHHVAKVTSRLYELDRALMMEILDDMLNCTIGLYNDSIGDVTEVDDAYFILDMDYYIQDYVIDTHGQSEHVCAAVQDYMRDVCSDVEWSFRFLLEQSTTPKSFNLYLSRQPNMLVLEYNQKGNYYDN